ncbi:MAG: PEGA domain-containing protein [Polyangiaceae bacterium]
MRHGVLRCLAWACLAGVLVACQAHVPSVSMRVTRTEATPRDASVYIDEQFVGFLGVVQARGVRLPEGEHRITVQRDGYFPWDRLVISDRTPIALHVELVPIPD